jgi:hypothetical protein
MEGFSEAMVKEWKCYRAVMIFSRGLHREFHVNTNVTKTLRGNDEKRLESKLSEHRGKSQRGSREAHDCKKGYLLGPSQLSFSS